MGILLQAADSTVTNIAQSSTPETLGNLLSKGGWIMYPLYLLFAASLFVFLNG